VRGSLPAITIRGFRGVVNSTTNHIITAMERGEPFDAALARMQAEGIAEADPSLDVDGWDAAAKTSALANVWLDARMTPRDVVREGIGPATAARARSAHKAGRRLKLIAEGRRHEGRDGREGRVETSVGLRELEAGDPLAALDGQGNALEIDTWPTGRIVITQRDGGLEKTAYALLSDLCEIGKENRPRVSVSVKNRQKAAFSLETDTRGRFVAPLTGVTIVDLSRVLAGPYCTMLAADMGARVIKIEHPERGDDTRAWGPPFIEGESAYYLSVNRNKESVALDFKTPDGRAALDALIARADVLVENFRPGTLDALGLGYRDLAARHPRLIYVSISGFGHTGPRRDEAGYDAVAQAESGLMSITGTADGPPVRLGVAIADIASGMFAYQGLLAALIARDRTGRGQHVDVGLLDAATALLTYQASRAFATGVAPGRSGNRHQSIAPYDTFDTADGALVLAVGNDALWPRFCRVAGLDLQAADARYATNAGRVTHYDELRPVIATALSRRPARDWIHALRAAGVPCGAVRSVVDALADPQLAAREMVVTVDHPTIGPLPLLGVPVKLSDTPGSVRTAPPRLGEHTEHVLNELDTKTDSGSRFPPISRH
jgi:formyl-CoA transferase/CoA:oxalate CoA-transferase